MTLRNFSKVSTCFQLPVKDEVKKTLWFSKPIFISASIPKTGFVPGEKIPIEIAVSNTSSTDIKEFVVSLNIEAKYKTRTSIATESDSKTLISLGIPIEEWSGKETTIRTSLVVPPTVPSSQNLCEILKVKYMVNVTARLKGLHLNPRVSLPCVIGLIHLGAVPKGESHSNNFEDYTMELPTYEEATFMTPVKQQGDLMDGDKKFVPLVATFKAQFS